MISSPRLYAPHLRRLTEEKIQQKNSFENFQPKKIDPEHIISNEIWYQDEQIGKTTEKSSEL